MMDYEHGMLGPRGSRVS